jgi:hypothetical protein
MTWPAMSHDISLQLVFAGAQRIRGDDHECYDGNGVTDLARQRVASQRSRSTSRGGIPGEIEKAVTLVML